MPPSTTSPPHPSQRWNDLVSAALLGIDRAQGATAPLVASPWLSAGGQEEEPVERFLNEVAALANYELAGRVPTTEASSAALPKCVASDRTCRPDAARHLAEILHGSRGDLLAEWCHAAIEGEWKAPPELIPSLLDEATRTKDAERRASLTTVVGARGAWLAGLRPEWRSLTVLEDQAPAPELWSTGSRDERLGLLRRLRGTDRDLAHQLVAGSWQAESAADRAAMLQQFAENLGPEDEPWLESCLDDRSKQVREVAAQLLSRLTQSAFAQRMTGRVSGLLHYEPARGVIKKKGPTIEATLPSGIDPSMKRDTLGEKTFPEMGPNASLLAQMVGFAPLAVWSDHPPQEWILAAMASEWWWPLVAGWTAAAQWQQNSPWAIVLLRQVFLAPSDKKHRAIEQLRGETIPNLVDVLERADRESLALRLLDEGLAGFDAAFDLLIASYTFPWSESLSRGVLSHLEGRLRDHKVSYDYQLRTFLLRVVAPHFAPSLAEEFSSRMERTFQEQTNKMFDTALEVGEMLRFRRDMLRSLAT